MLRFCVVFIYLFISAFWLFVCKALPSEQPVGRVGWCWGPVSHRCCSRLASGGKSCLCCYYVARLVHEPLLRTFGRGMLANNGIYSVHSQKAEVWLFFFFRKSRYLVMFCSYEKKLGLPSDWETCEDYPCIHRNVFSYGWKAKKKPYQHSPSHSPLAADWVERWLFLALCLSSMGRMLMLFLLCSILLLWELVFSPAAIWAVGISQLVNSSSWECNMSMYSWT